MKRIISLFLVLIMILSMAACSRNDDEVKTAVSVEEIKKPEYKSGQTITLKVYNWGEYISDGSEDSHFTVAPRLRLNTPRILLTRICTQSLRTAQLLTISLFLPII